MAFWPEFFAGSWGREFVAGGFGGIAGVISGHPFDTLRIRQQSSKSGASSVSILRHVMAKEGVGALYRGMGAPLASITFQNAMVFQIYAILSRAFDSSNSTNDPPSYTSVALGGVGAGAIQSILMSPVELVKIHLQLQNRGSPNSAPHTTSRRGPISVAKRIWRIEGFRGIFRGLNVTVLRDAPSHGFYFWTYEYTREKLHPGCRRNNDESLITMLVAGGVAGVVSWVSCYPLDVVKTRLQAQPPSASQKYNGTFDCFCKCVNREGHGVLWRGFGTTVARAFVVNGAVFAAYEVAMRYLFNKGSNEIEKTT